MRELEPIPVVTVERPDPLKRLNSGVRTVVFIALMLVTLALIVNARTLVLPFVEQIFGKQGGTLAVSLLSLAGCGMCAWVAYGEWRKKDRWALPALFGAYLLYQAFQYLDLAFGH